MLFFYRFRCLRRLTLHDLIFCLSKLRQLRFKPWLNLYINEDRGTFQVPTREFGHGESARVQDRDLKLGSNMGAWALCAHVSVDTAAIHALHTPITTCDTHIFKKWRMIERNGASMCRVSYR